MIHASISDAILIDEVGIESGAFGRFRLKSICQPIFSPVGDGLEMTAVRAAATVQIEGRPATGEDLARSPIAIDPRLLKGLGQALNVGNYRNLSVAGCMLFLDHDLGENRRLHDAMLSAHRRACALGESGVDADHLVCRIGKGAPRSESASAALDELRRIGIRIAFDLFDEAFDIDDLLSQFRPDIAEISAPWLFQTAGERAAAKLFKPLAEARKCDGTGIFIHGISTVEELRLALDVGADYLAGDYLALATPVGAVMDDEPRSIAHLLTGPRRQASRPA